MRVADKSDAGRPIAERCQRPLTGRDRREKHMTDRRCRVVYRRQIICGK